MSISAVPLLTIAMADVPREDAGLASGIVNVSMWLASSTALAIFGTLAANKTSALVTQGRSVAEASVAGYHVTFFVGAVLAAGALVLTATVLRSAANRETLANEASAALVQETSGEIDVLEGF
jgi:hypothetical protein